VSPIEESQQVYPPDPHRSVILIGDDEPVILDLVQTVLRAEGYQILSARDGEEALGISRKYRGAIDAVPADLSLPKIDGLELRARLSAERPGIKALLMSGYIFPLPDRSPLLTKPSDLETLKQRIRDLLGSATRTRRAGG